MPLLRTARRPLQQLPSSRRSSLPCYPLRIPDRPLLRALWGHEGLTTWQRFCLAGGRTCPKCGRIAPEHRFRCTEKGWGVRPRDLAAHGAFASGTRR